MPRSKVFRNSDYPYHVVNRTNTKAFFKLPLKIVYDLFETWINLATCQYGIQTHHFELMSNHIHWILSTPKSNIDRAMMYVFSSIAKDINEITGVCGRLWGGPYKYSVLDSPSSYFAVTKYLYRNSPKAGLVSCAEDYPYSTLQTYYGYYPSKIWIFPCLLTPNIDYNHKFLEWLNVPFKSEDHNQIKNSLNNYRFKFRRTTRNKRYQPEIPGWITS
jgi:REP element-mobilizing transposase RayT